MMDIQNILIFSFLFLIVLIYVIQDFTQRLFIIIISLIFGYLYYIKNVKNTNIKKGTRQEFINHVEKKLSGEFELIESSIFNLHKTPKTLKYIKKTEEMQIVLYELKFLTIYNPDLFYKLISYIEYFLKIHYKLMLGKYEFKLYYQTLKDVRIEILNILKSTYLTLPKTSTILLIPDINEYMEKRIKVIQAITYRYLKIICQKYKKPFKPPNEFDNDKDKHYALF